MPHKSKWLVIAGFLASYNPKKYDSRYFTRGGEGKSRVGKKGGANNGSNSRSQLCGPKDFDVPRMLGIFHYIMPDDCKITFDIYTQIATLVSLRVFVKLSSAKRIDVMKLKCNVSYAFVKQLAKSMRFDISKYLYDWVDTEA
jgi:origin recognition complex subunit 5